ncbi:MAG: hypothetical protein JWP74_1376 [Marmoricola sp.]|nr:hypothetical protein [Marmoricola sp.]
MIDVAPELLLVVLDIYCLIDVLLSRDDQVRNLPKIAWFILILIVPVIGSIVWLFAGRPQGARPGGRASSGPSYGPSTSAFPEYDRPGRAAGLTPESDDDFLKRVRERAEEQRRKEAENRRRAAEEGTEA